jgi:membrane protein YdbS with pleckstrin-like domain
MRSRLRPGEEAVLVVHRHPIALFGPAILTLLLFGAFGASWMSPEPALRIGAGALFGVVAVWALGRWLAWRADLWVVTTQRVIDESGVLTVKMMDSPLEIIQNVGCEQSIFGRMLGFGRVSIQTAAEQGMMTLEGIGRPETLRDAILDMKERRRAGAGPGARGGSGS